MLFSSSSSDDVEDTVRSSSSSSFCDGRRATSSRSSSLDNLSEVFQLLSSTASSSSSSFSSFGSSSYKCSFSEEEYPVAGQRHHEMVMQHKCVNTVTAGHVGLVSAMEAAGEYLYTASGAGGVRVWRQLDLAPCSRRRLAEGEGARALLVAGDWVFSAGGQDHRIDVWRRRRPSRPEGGAAMRHVASLPTARDRLLRSLSQSNYVQVRRHHKKLWIQHTDVVTALAISSDHNASIISSSNTHKKKMEKQQERLLFSASWDRTVKVWRLSDMKCVESIAAHCNAVNALATSPSSAFLYTASSDGLIKAWSRSSACCKHTLVATRPHSSQAAASSVNALAISPAGDFLYSGGSDGAIAVWRISNKDADDNKHLRLACKLKGHRLPILCLYSTQNNLLLSGSADKSVRVWRRMDSCAEEEMNQGCSELRWCCVAVLKGHRGPVKSICVAEDQLVGGCVAYTGSTDKSIKMWWLSRELMQGCSPSPNLDAPFM